jgi:hypothetical protein
MINFAFDWSEVKGTKFYFDRMPNPDWYMLTWITDDEETIIRAWILEPIYNE